MISTQRVISGSSLLPILQSRNQTHELWLRLLALSQLSYRHIEPLKINEVEIIDTTELELIYKGLGLSLEKTLLSGLKLRLAGYYNSNKKQFDSGQAIIINWLTWFSQNKQKIQEAFIAYQ